MSVCELHDPAVIERALRTNEAIHIYEIGDLDDFFRPYTRWFARGDTHDPDAVVLLYTGGETPTVIGLSEDPAGLREILASVSDLLPERFYAHLTEGAESALIPPFSGTSQGRHLKMLRRGTLPAITGTLPVRLDRDCVGELQSFYDYSYPGHWFDPRMLETGKYFGIRRNGRLVSAAGIHVYSPNYKVAAIGNVATHPQFRRRGLAGHVTSAVCRSLRDHIEHIGLNVGA
ncbi:MAG: GNAT family N-acetyltransferase, partial [bacterium]